MSRIRTVKPEFWEDETIALLSREARLLFIGTLNLADDEGLLRWNAAYIKASLFMYDDDLGVSKVKGLMQEVVDQKLIFPYRGGKVQQPMAMVVHFHKHQKINRPTPSRFTPPCIQNPQVRLMYGRRDGMICHLCRGEIDEKATVRKFVLSLDHRVPRSEGGSDYPTNISIAHCGCNSSRGTDPLVDPLMEDSVSDSLALYEDITEPSPLEGKGKEKEIEGKGSGVSDVVPTEATRLADLLADLIEQNGSLRPNVTQAWTQAIDRMIRIDKRSEGEIDAAIRWCQADEFWHRNILSPAKLREKFDRLRLDAQAKNRKQRGPGGETIDRIDSLLARMEN